MFLISNPTEQQPIPPRHRAFPDQTFPGLHQGRTAGTLRQRAAHRWSCGQRLVGGDTDVLCGSEGEGDGVFAGDIKLGRGAVFVE